MKIFYNAASNLHLTKYGIEIPLSDDRDGKIFHFLEQEGIPVIQNFSESIELKKEDLARVHNEKFLSELYGSKESLRKAIRDTFELVDENGKYHRYNPQKAQAPLEEMFDSFLLKTKGTIATVQEALKYGQAYFLGGGYHHAMSFGGRGFCLINDIVIAARWAQKNLDTKLVWVIDVDAHKGDGTAELTHNDPSIKTLSIHMKDGWPLDSDKFDREGKLNPWFIESDVEIGIPQGGDAQYLQKLGEGLAKLESLSKERPDIAIIVQGSDPYEKDQLPSSCHLKLTKDQMLERDLLVYNFLKERNIPQAYVISGGYGEFVYEIYCQFLKKVHNL